MKGLLQEVELTCDYVGWRVTGMLSKELGQNTAIFGHSRIGQKFLPSGNPHLYACASVYEGKQAMLCCLSASFYRDFGILNVLNYQ